MTSAYGPDLLAKINDLPRRDYGQYEREIAKFTEPELDQIYSDWRLYRRALLWVDEIQPDGRFAPVRWMPRPWQEAYEGLSHDSRFDKVRRSNFDLILKSRKTGATTDVSTEHYAKAATRSRQKGLFISFEEQTAKDAASILKNAHNMNPLQPKMERNNDDGMEFKTTGSTIGYRTAGAKVLARGLNLNFLHMTEVAHFYKSVENAGNFTAGVLDALARGGRVIWETTPNGEDPIFHRAWVGAQELWRQIFLSIFMDESVDWGANHPEALESTRSETFPLGDNERYLIESLGATRGHIRFLRFEKQKLNDRSPSHPTTDQIVGDERLLLQEYPIDDKSCFLSTAETVFEPTAVAAHRANMRAPFSILRNGEHLIWEKPTPGRPYVFFGDTSEGLPSSDWQAGCVLDPNKLKYVARTRVKMGDWYDVAKHWVEVATEYNEALLMVERNNHGTTILYIIENDFKYPNVMYMDATDYSDKHVPGWITDKVTKPLMVAQFKEAFETGALEINDEEALHEISRYRLVPQATARGQDKYQAPSGENDDLVVCYMGAYQGVDLAFTLDQARPMRYGDFA